MGVLIVDDDADVRRVLGRFLAERGLPVRTAASGQEALALMADRPPEVVVSDIRMAGIDGIELLQAVRTRFPGIPCILMTGHGDASAVHAVQHGAFDYLKKPIKLRRLLECIQAARGRSELEQQVLAESRQLLWPRAGSGQRPALIPAVDEWSELVAAAERDVQRLSLLWQEVQARLEAVAAADIVGRQDHDIRNLIRSAHDKLSRLGALGAPVSGVALDTSSTLGRES